MVVSGISCPETILNKKSSRGDMSVRISHTYLWYRLNLANLTYFEVFILNFEFLVVYHGCNFLCSCWKCIDIYIFSHICANGYVWSPLKYRYAVFILIYKYLNLYQRDVQMFMEFNKNNALLKLIFLSHTLNTTFQYFNYP